MSGDWGSTTPGSPEFSNGRPRGTPPLDSLTRTQARMRDAVGANPGITITGIANMMDCAHSTATCHLKTLTRLGYVVNERDGRTMRHYLPHQIRDSNVRMALLTSDDRKRMVIQYLARQGNAPISINKMARGLNLPFNSLKAILLSLEGEEIVQLERKNGRYRILRLPRFRDVAENLDQAAALEEAGPGPSDEDGQGEIPLPQ